MYIIKQVLGLASLIFWLIDAINQGLISDVPRFIRFVSELKKEIVLLHFVYWSRFPQVIRG